MYHELSQLLTVKSTRWETKEIVLKSCNLTGHWYSDRMSLLQTRGWGQIFDDLHKVERDEAGRGADLSPGPLLSDVRLQLDHVSLRERQLVLAGVALKVELRHASRTAVAFSTIRINQSDSFRSSA